MLKTLSLESDFQGCLRCYRIHLLSPFSLEQLALVQMEIIYFHNFNFTSVEWFTQSCSYEVPELYSLLGQICTSSFKGSICSSRLRNDCRGGLGRECQSLSPPSVCSRPGTQGAEEGAVHRQGQNPPAHGFPGEFRRDPRWGQFTNGRTEMQLDSGIWHSQASLFHHKGKLNCHDLEANRRKECF